MKILGLNAFHADAAACILVDGKIVAAAEEERFNRVKHSAGFPRSAIRSCLREARIELKNLDHVVLAHDPSANESDEIFQILSGRPSYPERLREKLSAVVRFRDVRKMLEEDFFVSLEESPLQIHAVEHLLAHLALGHFASGHPSATLLAVDGLGDLCSTMIGTASGNAIDVREKVLYPHSMAVFYQMVSQFLGFDAFGDGGKVMGMAACGEPILTEKMLEICRPVEKGLFELDLDYFTHHRRGLDMSWDGPVPVLEKIYSEKMLDVFGDPRRKNEPIDKRHQDMAASLQRALEVGLSHLIQRAHALHPQERLVLAGGTMTNCVALSRIRAGSPFKDIFVQPIPSDAGTALGAALYVDRCQNGNTAPFSLPHPYLGPRFDKDEIENMLKGRKIAYHRGGDTVRRAAELLAEGKVVGWFQGRMEYGPRALGNRSLLADPRSPEMPRIVNRRVKYRHEFRPFGASILLEHIGDYFHDARPSPFMLECFQVQRDKLREIPAVTHVDGTCRAHTVDQTTNPPYRKLLEAFRELTGVPLLLNTSLNENEPIVCTPDEALHCFRTTRMDALVLEDILVTKD
jgi:carbamoyltransferase